HGRGDRSAPAGNGGSMRAPAHPTYAMWNLSSRYARKNNDLRRICFRKNRVRKHGEGGWEAPRGLHLTIAQVLGVLLLRVRACAWEAVQMTSRRFPPRAQSLWRANQETIRRDHQEM